MTFWKHGYDVLNSEVGLRKAVYTGFIMKETKFKGSFKYVLGASLAVYLGFWPAVAGWIAFDLIGAYVEGKKYYAENVSTEVED